MMKAPSVRGSLPNSQYSFGCGLPDTLKGMHQWWSEMASMSLLIVGATAVNKGKKNKVH